MLIHSLLYLKNNFYVIKLFMIQINNGSRNGKFSSEVCNANYCALILYQLKLPLKQITFHKNCQVTLQLTLLPIEIISPIKIINDYRYC